MRLYRSVCLNIVSSIVMTAPLTQAYYPPSGAERAQSHLGQEMSAERGALAAATSRGEPRTIWFTGEDGQEGALTSTVLTIWFFKCFRELYSLAQQLGIITNTVDREKDILLKGFVYLSSFHSFYYLKIFQHQTRQGQGYDRKVNLETSIPGASV